MNLRIPDDPTPDWAVGFLDDHLSRMEAIRPARLITDLRRAASPEAAWVARQLELGNIEVRVSPGYLVTESGQSAPGAFVNGSALARGTGIIIATRGHEGSLGLVVHEGTHFHDELFELATGIRISTRAAELHAYLAIQRLHLYQQHAIDGVLDPAVAKALMAPFRADVARRLDAGYYATATSLSVVERGRVFLEAFRRSRMFPAGEELRRDAAREILGLVPIAR